MTDPTATVHYQIFCDDPKHDHWMKFWSSAEVLGYVAVRRSSRYKPFTCRFTVEKVTTTTTTVREALPL